MDFNFLQTTFWEPSLRRIVTEDWFVEAANIAARNAIEEDPYIGEWVEDLDEGPMFLAKVEFAPDEDDLFAEFYATYVGQGRPSRTTHRVARESL